MLINEIELDPGNGSFRQISIGGTTSVNFSSSGIKTMRLKVTLSNGKQLLTHSKIEVLSNLRTKSATNIQKVTITGDAYKGVQTSAEVSILSRDGRIKTPLIFVEGFDPVTPMTITGKGYGFGTIYQLGEELTKPQNSFVKNIILEMFDIIYVDWEDSENYIQANSNTLIKIIDWINQQKKMSNSKSSNIIIGHSMGGLIVRHALKTMENNNKTHETSHYVSYDAPHLGANVPLGVLYALYGTMSFLENQKFIGHYVNKEVDSGTYLEIAERIVHSNAARQMLVNYVDFGGNLNHSLHNSWQSELASLGFPQGDKDKNFRMVAIANGSYSSNNVPSTYLTANFSASSDIVDMILPFVSGAVIGVVLDDMWAGLLTLLPGKSTIKGHFEINPGVSLGKRITNIELKYKKKFAWLVNINRTIFSYKKDMHGGLTYDIFPSSTFELESVDDKEGGEIPIIGGADYNVTATSYIPFIPISSALCVGAGKKPLTASMFTSRPSVTDIPFGDNYYVQENNSISHTDFDTKALEWMAGQIAFGIDGPKLGKAGSKYSVKFFGLISTTAIWSSDNNNIASINKDGILTVQNKGVVTITAQANYLGKTIKLSKRIVVGTPRFILEEVKREPGFYNIKAKCIDTQIGYADFILDNKNIIVYKWGIKTNEKPIEWITSDSHEIKLSTLEDKDNTTIYLKTIDIHGNESTPIFVRISGYDIYDLGIKTLVFNCKGDVYSDEGIKLNYQKMNMPLIFRATSHGEFNNAKWNPVAAVIVNEENEQRGILWNRNGYIRDIISPEEKERILTFTDGKVVVYRLMILNFDGEIIQRTPFNVMYKTNFPK